MTGRIRDDEFSFWSREVPVSNIDRDALLALRSQTIRQQREIDTVPSAAFVFAARAFDLIFKCTLSLHQ